MTSEQKVAWAAGIFEGEGSCSWTSKEHNCQEMVVLQRHPQILNELAGYFGGKVTERHLKNPLSNNGDYRWRLSGPRARKFLSTIYPLLSPRRKAQVARIGVFDNDPILGLS